MSSCAVARCPGSQAKAEKAWPGWSSETPQRQRGRSGLDVLICRDLLAEVGGLVDKRRMAATSSRHLVDAVLRIDLIGSAQRLRLAEEVHA